MGMLWPTLEFILGISMIITLLVGGHEVICSSHHARRFVAFNTYMILLIWPIIAVGWVVNLFQRGTASVKRIDEELASRQAVGSRQEPPEPAIPAEFVLQGDIELRTRFQWYGNIPEYVRDVSLDSIWFKWGLGWAPEVGTSYW